MRLNHKAAVGVAVALVVGVGVAATQLSTTSQARGDLDRFELTSIDLPDGYTQAARVRFAAGCSDPAFDRADALRQRARGVVGCSLTKYRRSAASGDVGGLVYLRGYLFDDAQRASAALAQLRAEYVAGAAGPPVVSRHGLAVPELGDQALRGVRLELGDGSAAHGSALAYWWRRGRVVAALVAFGDLDNSAVLSLTHRIDERAGT